MSSKSSSPAMAAAVDGEIEDLARWLGLELARLSGDWGVAEASPLDGGHR